MFHFRVRDGTGWDHQAKTTGVLMQSLLGSLAALGQLSRVSLLAGGSSVDIALSGRLTSAQRLVVL